MPRDVNAMMFINQIIFWSFKEASQRKEHKSWWYLITVIIQADEATLTPCHQLFWNAAWIKICDKFYFILNLSGNFSRANTWTCSYKNIFCVILLLLNVRVLIGWKWPQDSLKLFLMVEFDVHRVAYYICTLRWNFYRIGSKTRMHKKFPPPFQKICVAFKN